MVGTVPFEVVRWSSDVHGNTGDVLSMPLDLRFSQAKAAENKNVKKASPFSLPPMSPTLRTKQWLENSVTGDNARMSLDSSPLSNTVRESRNSAIELVDSTDEVKGLDFRAKNNEEGASAKRGENKEDEESDIEKGAKIDVDSGRVDAQLTKGIASPALGIDVVGTPSQSNKLVKNEPGLVVGTSDEEDNKTRISTSSNKESQRSPHIAPEDITKPASVRSQGAAEVRPRDLKIPESVSSPKEVGKGSLPHMSEDLKSKNSHDEQIGRKGKNKNVEVLFSPDFRFWRSSSFIHSSEFVEIAFPPSFIKGIDIIPHPLETPAGVEVMVGYVVEEKMTMIGTLAFRPPVMELSQVKLEVKRCKFEAKATSIFFRFLPPYPSKFNLRQHTSVLEIAVFGLALPPPSPTMSISSLLGSAHPKQVKNVVRRDNMRKTVEEEKTRVGGYGRTRFSDEVDHLLSNLIGYPLASKEIPFHPRESKRRSIDEGKRDTKEVHASTSKSVHSESLPDPTAALAAVPTVRENAIVPTSPFSRQLREIGEKKQDAVDNEDFDLAARLKAIEVELGSLQVDLNMHVQQKLGAVRDEDFASAKKAKACEADVRDRIQFLFSAANDPSLPLGGQSPPRPSSSIVRGPNQKHRSFVEKEREELDLCLGRMEGIGAATAAVLPPSTPPLLATPVRLSSATENDAHESESKGLADFGRQTRESRSNASGQELPLDGISLVTRADSGGLPAMHIDSVRDSRVEQASSKRISSVSSGMPSTSPSAQPHRPSDVPPLTLQSPRKSGGQSPPKHSSRNVSPGRTEVADTVRRLGYSDLAEVLTGENLRERNAALLLLEEKEETRKQKVVKDEKKRWTELNEISAYFMRQPSALSFFAGLSLFDFCLRSLADDVGESVDEKVPNELPLPEPKSVGGFGSKAGPYPRDFNPSRRDRYLSARAASSIRPSPAPSSLLSHSSLINVYMPSLQVLAERLKDSTAKVRSAAAAALTESMFAIAEASLPYLLDRSDAEGEDEDERTKREENAPARTFLLIFPSLIKDEKVDRSETTRKSGKEVSWREAVGRGFVALQLVEAQAEMKREDSSARKIVSDEEDFIDSDGGRMLKTIIHDLVGRQQEQCRRAAAELTTAAFLLFGDGVVPFLLEGMSSRSSEGVMSALEGEVEEMTQGETDPPLGFGRWLLREEFDLPNPFMEGGLHAAALPSARDRGETKEEGGDY
mmetsp:Transcript_29363/g.75738  ORF Transcript_29363/g.75738 Transcript_29363/m.75738 type:complete len:1214 (-) Transcript_29363:1729-5370(-)